MTGALIGVSGYARSGKDAVGLYLEQRYGFRRARFAAVLKDVCVRVFGFTPEQIDGAEKELPDPRYPMSGTCPTCGALCSSDGDGWLCEDCRRLWPSHVTPRIAMQTLGTEWGRRLHADIWVEATLRPLDLSQRWVVCDVRFPNEVAGVRRYGGRVIRRLRGAPESDHPSETALADRPDLYDAGLGDFDTVEKLHAEIDRLMAQWGISPV